MANCPDCGEFMYEGRPIDRFDTCGKRECDRAACDAMEAERQERHEAIDREYEY